MPKARRTAGADTGSDRSAQTRALLVGGAIDALRAVGFAGCSAREIASRAGCNQALVFYHFGSVTDLLLAALDEISARRLAAYQPLLDGRPVTELVRAARSIFIEDLDAGHTRVLVEMITGAHSVPGLGEQVAQRLRPWREFTEQAVRGVLESSPVSLLLPVREVADALVAGFLALELLAGLDGDRRAALALFDRAAGIAALLDQFAVTELFDHETEERS